MLSAGGVKHPGEVSRWLVPCLGAREASSHGTAAVRARQRRARPGLARPNTLPLASGRGRKLKTPISLAQGRGSRNEPIKVLRPQLKFAWKLLAQCSRALRPSQLRLQTLRLSRNPERNGPAAAGLPQVTQGKPVRY
ncbi:hypothetical protein KIL84_008820 [Mauremys mutica]|uniref:Uncharacterized protein n=1 Tax=Mauremys mutica TaxID=74926 RepID=A0A9D3X6K4_9SAUR|nr:hypothetical protein KIL84_008820 [Mauremys mutica]